MEEIRSKTIILTLSTCHDPQAAMLPQTINQLLMNNGQKTVCMLSSLHQPFDDRIYWKEAVSLQKAGYKVIHVSVGLQDDDTVSDNGIRLIRIKRFQGFRNLFVNALAKRFSKKSEYRRMVGVVRALKADVCHLHDLQLLRIAKSLKRLPHAPRVVYDVHEPYPVTIADGEYGNAILQAFMKLYARLVHFSELRRAAVCDLVIATEEHVAGKFQAKYPSKPVSVVYNYCNWSAGSLPAPDELRYDFVYAGGIRRRRGAVQMVQAVAKLREEGVRATLLLVGPVCDAGLKEELLHFIERRQIADRVELRGEVPYREVMKLYTRSKCGMAVFNRQQVNQIIMPIKLFEYIAFGLPAVGSDSGHIGRIIRQHGTGLCVDPDDVEEIASAMKRLLTDTSLYQQQRNNCLKLYNEQFNWQRMEDHLLQLYAKLLTPTNEA